jgi:hypothetical protein
MEDLILRIASSRWRRGIATLVLVFASTAYAGTAGKSWRISELEQAPLLAVCTVEDIVQREPVTAGTVQWAGSYRWHELTLRVERVHSKLALAPVGGDRITVRYIGYGEPVSGHGGSPIWPIFRKSQRAVFPLSPSKERSDRWVLFAAEGARATVPATAKEWRSSDGPVTPHEFIVSELINALASGSPAEQSAASTYMGGLWGNVPAETQRLLDAAIGSDEERWLAVAASLVSSLGVPRPSVAEIMSGGVGKDSLHGPILAVLAHALQMGAKREFPDRLITKLVDDAPVHAWGSAVTLMAFKDSPVLIDRLGDALSRNREGAVTIAWSLVRSGQRAVLPQALAAAQELVMNPGPVNMAELQAASGLVRDDGDDAQFGTLVATLRRLKTADVEQYRKLYSSAGYSQNKREIEIAAVLIDDMREGFSSMRYCDVAAGTLQHLSGQDFGIGQNMTRPDWDRAVGRARDWLAKR